MKVVLLESLGIAAEKVEEKAAFLREAGHSFEAKPTKETWMRRFRSQERVMRMRL